MGPGKQITVSEGHPFHSRDKRDKRDLGGDFSTSKSYVEGGLPPRVKLFVKDKYNPSRGTYQSEFYDGYILPTRMSNLVFPTSIASSSAALDAAGATAIARCKPTNSVADVATFLGELHKDGLPSVVGSRTWKRRTATAKDAGDEFLNYEFGWLPLVNDVKKFTKAVSHADAVLKQYERDAGKVVRRHYSFPEQTTTSEQVLETVAGAQAPVVFNVLATGPFGQVTRRVETYRRQWFSGAFTYALPSGYDSRNAMDRYALMADVVFGASLSPDILWELAPWSWAVDWFSNTGDVVSNISDWATHGLVMRYGYMMEHTIVKHTYSLSKSGLLNNSITVPPITLVTETKIRRRANPFGFGLTWNGLSPLQVAIAGAIGLTR